VENHPATIWLIGNEPDCIWQDSRTPEQYAHDYHELYYYIKGLDPTAQIAAGGIVQPTPIRLAYLDRVLAEHQQFYGQPMPVDVWAIHNAILNERPGQWGCDVPPGMDASLALTVPFTANDSFITFTLQIEAFREWMADNGYQGYPLIVTEYGVLMPDDYGYDEARVNAYMSATFDWLATATDPQVGDPSDGYRLVQRWAWYSLDDQPWDPISQEGFNGNLFDPFTTQITAFGQNFASFTSGFSPLPHVDLTLSRLWTERLPVLPGPTGTLTVTLLVEVQNLGTVDSGPFRVGVEYSGPVSGSAGNAVDNVPAASTAVIEITLPDLLVGGYSILGVIDADRQVTESTECNNGFSGMVVAPAHRSALTLVPRRYTGMARLKGSEGKHTPSEAAGSPGFREWPMLTANSYPGQIAINPADGVVWISERDGNRIARFDPQTEGLIEYTIPTTDSQPWGVAVDGAGDVWFAETAGNKIGRFDPQTEAFVEYSVPTTDSLPWDVAIDGSGVVWFTEKAGNKVGKLEPGTGAITEYGVPTANAQPSGLAIHGSKGWLAETGASKLGRVLLASGAIAEASTNTPNSGPQDVAVNLAGFPWLTETQVSKIALFKVSTIGGFVEYDVPTPDSEPYGIALDHDGVTVWFTERAGNKVGRFDRAFAEFPLPTPSSSPTGIAQDSAGCVWYAAPTANQIGRLCATRVFLPLTLKNR